MQPMTDAIPVGARARRVAVDLRRALRAFIVYEIAIRTLTIVPAARDPGAPEPAGCLMTAAGSPDRSPVYSMAAPL
jgi:hypothetical protein